jgi:hypothetical protein
MPKIELGRGRIRQQSASSVDRVRHEDRDRVRFDPRRGRFGSRHVAELKLTEQFRFPPPAQEQ